MTAGISQFRDNYGKQIIEIQLTNNSTASLTMLGAELTSPLFSSGIIWQPADGGIGLPPGQAKSLPAPLPAPDCTQGSVAASAPAGGPEDAATVSLRLAPAAALAEPQPLTAPAADPYGVLPRNNAEMCLAEAAAAVAGFRLEPDLDVSADGRSAVVRLAITPRNPGTADAGTLTIDRIEGTTLLEEDPGAPWPRSVEVSASAQPEEVRLRIRPARCDPHAVAEDKVGTLLPLRVRAGGREGVLKVDAGGLLRGRIYDFVTAACGGQ
ncbi:hypothetical protein E5206_12505 [Arthrobacter sp. PAMC25564]|nr:hypothetical protein E5206_12505 [Arthrobacter sp. PAMC25564]